MAVPDKVTKRIRVDFKGAKGDIKEEIKREVGEYVVREINSYLNSAKSPVDGGRYKRTKQPMGKKGRPGLSRLFEDGDLRAAISFEEYRDGIEVGVFDSSQVGKAYGHNTGFEGHPTLAGKGYIREFIPKKDQEFDSKIKEGIKSIVESKIANKDSN